MFFGASGGVCLNSSRSWNSNGRILSPGSRILTQYGHIPYHVPPIEKRNICRTFPRTTKFHQGESSGSDQKSCALKNGSITSRSSSVTPFMAAKHSFGFSHHPISSFGSFTRRSKSELFAVPSFVENGLRICQTLT